MVDILKAAGFQMLSKFDPKAIVGQLGLVRPMCNLTKQDNGKDTKGFEQRFDASEFFSHIA